MTREAKIGMLTGLGVIVLIGVLLSEYLGDPKGMLGGPGSAGGTMGAAGGPASARAAELPVGAAYRQQMTEPIGVPGMGQLPGGNGATPAFSMATAVIPAYATEAVPDPAASGPTVGTAVSAVTVEPVPVDTQVATGPQTFHLQDGHDPVKPLPPVEKTGVTKMAAGTTPGVTYEILPGDNLAKIAKKFYNSNKLSDVQKIVAANPALLKDANTMLMAGKKLTIPNGAAMASGAATRPAPVAAKPGATPAPTMRKTDSVMIYLPGPLAGTGNDTKMTAKVDIKADATGATVAAGDGSAGGTAKKPSGKTYVVQSGDTLEKIAKKIAPGNPTEMIEKLKTANAIKDVHGLQIGQPLKLPI